MAILRYKKSTQEDLAVFAGKWVALVKGKVIESAVTLPELMAKLRRKSRKEKPSIMLVPREDEGPYILILVP